MDVPALLDKYGFPVVIVGGIAWFWLKHLWPFLKEQIERWQTERTTERAEFVEALRQLYGMAQAQHLAHTQEHTAFTHQVESLSKAIEQLAQAVRELSNDRP